MAPFYYAPYDVLNVTPNSWLVLLFSRPAGMGGGRSAAPAGLSPARIVSGVADGVAGLILICNILLGDVCTQINTLATEVSAYHNPQTWHSLTHATPSRKHSARTKRAYPHTKRPEKTSLHSLSRSAECVPYSVVRFNGSRICI